MEIHFKGKLSRCVMGEHNVTTACWDDVGSCSFLVITDRNLDWLDEIRSGFINLARLNENQMNTEWEEKHKVKIETINFHCRLYGTFSTQPAFEGFGRRYDKTINAVFAALKEYYS